MAAFFFATLTRGLGVLQLHALECVWAVMPHTAEVLMMSGDVSIKSFRREYFSSVFGLFRGL